MKRLLHNFLSFGRVLAAGFVLSASGSVVLGQSTVTVGTMADGSAEWLPISGYYNFSYSQQLYYPAQFGTYAGQSGTITKLRFLYVSGGESENNSWNIYMGNTAQATFSSNTNWIPTASMTQVFNGTVDFPAANNWVDITLTTPFVWDGTSNLVIAVDENASGYSATQFQKTEVGSNRAIFYRNDYTNPNPASPPNAGGRHGHVPNIQLVMTASQPCSGTVALSNTLSSSTEVCSGESVVLSLSGDYYATGIEYQWQQNDGSGWTDIADADSTVYMTSVTDTMDFRAQITCVNSMLSEISTPVTVNVKSNPVISVNTSEMVTCPGEPANITAAGADTYVWSPATGVTPNTTAASVFLAPATTTNYRVIGTTNGCSDTAWVNVIPMNEVTVSLSQLPTEICEPGSAVDLSLSTPPMDITSDGTWQYRWLAADGTTVAQNWNSASGYTFIPTADSVYTFYYQLRSTSCPNDAIDSVPHYITVGFGADVDLTAFNCNTEGIIELSDVFGQATLSEVYTNTFSGGSDLTNVIMTGNASLTDDRLQLTPSAGNSSGYAQIMVPGQGILNNALSVSFKMTADMPIDNYGTGGADGITYSFGNDATPAGNGTSPNGKGTKLRLSFDSASNGTENGNAPGIYLVYGWTAGNAFGPNNTQTLAYSDNIELWKGLTDVPVELNITANGVASVTVDGTVIFENIQMPQAYVDADISSWTHLFSAGTGGDALRHAVKDLQISMETLEFGISQGAMTVEPAEWQNSNVFSNLTPGIYNIWISKDETAECSKNIGQFEILNTNPVVDLGDDMAICEDDTITLDAGNPGSVYTWSGSNAFTQTIEVSEAGSYIVYVTNPDGCLGIGTINIEVNEAPSAGTIFTTGNFPTVTFSALNVENADTYTWNFGDGTAPVNGPATIDHSYDEDGTYSVTLTLTNDCGTETVTQSITIDDFASLSENAISGLEVYPNPATNNVTIKLPNSENSSVTVYSMSGALVHPANSFTGQTSVTLNGWDKGVYFLHISNGTITTIEKLIVQ